MRQGQWASVHSCNQWGNQWRQQRRPLSEAHCQRSTWQSAVPTQGKPPTPLTCAARFLRLKKAMAGWKSR